VFQGYYCPAGATTYYGCPTGQYAGGSSCGCTNCPCGQYQNLALQSSCKACPAVRVKSKQLVVMCAQPSFDFVVMAWSEFSELNMVPNFVSLVFFTSIYIMLRRATTAPLPPRRTTRAQPATTAPQARAITTGAQQENILRRRSQPALTAPVGSTRTLLLSQAARRVLRYVSLSPPAS